ncbi:hypothetical protein [Candidatus Synechococcus spongiarum]|uniref:hypothetical protein n=1 Tax=Candidatus Synechococcus spongiarum TaxID=431041 RepID=UPI00054ED526|nr:hypothetical protein [Candidatus Synechococcus spongiarum]
MEVGDDTGLGLAPPVDLRTGFSPTGDLAAAGLGGAMSGGGCLATGGLAALSGGVVPLAGFAAAFLTAADTLDGLLITDGDFGDLPPGDPARALDAFPAPAVVATSGDFLGAVGRTTVGRTSLGFWSGLGSVDGDLPPGDPARALDAFPAPAAVATSGGFLGAVGAAAVGRTSLGFWSGLGSADGGFTSVRPAFALDLLPRVFPLAG